MHLSRLRQVAKSLDVALADSTLRSQLTILGGLRTTLNLAALMSLMDDKVSVVSACEKDCEPDPSAKIRETEPFLETRSADAGAKHIANSSLSCRYSVSDSPGKAPALPGRAKTGDADEDETGGQTALAQPANSSPGHSYLGMNGGPAGRSSPGARSERAAVRSDLKGAGQVGVHQSLLPADTQGAGGIAGPDSAIEPSVLDTKLPGDASSYRAEPRISHFEKEHGAAVKETAGGLQALQASGRPVLAQNASRHPSAEGDENRRPGDTFGTDDREVAASQGERSLSDTLGGRSPEESRPSMGQLARQSQVDSAEPPPRAGSEEPSRRAGLEAGTPPSRPGARHSGEMSSRGLQSLTGSFGEDPPAQGRGKISRVGEARPPRGSGPADAPVGRTGRGQQRPQAEAVAPARARRPLLMSPTEGGSAAARGPEHAAVSPAVESETPRESPGGEDGLLSRDAETGRGIEPGSGNSWSGPRPNRRGKEPLLGAESLAGLFVNGNPVSEKEQADGIPEQQSRGKTGLGRAHSSSQSSSWAESETGQSVRSHNPDTVLSRKAAPAQRPEVQEDAVKSAEVRAHAPALSAASEIPHQAAGAADHPSGADPTRRGASPVSWSGLFGSGVGRSHGISVSGVESLAGFFDKVVSRGDRARGMRGRPLPKALVQAPSDLSRNQVPQPGMETDLRSQPRSDHRAIPPEEQSSRHRRHRDFPVSVQNSRSDGVDEEPDEAGRCPPSRQSASAGKRDLLDKAPLTPATVRDPSLLSAVAQPARGRKSGAPLDTGALAREGRPRGGIDSIRGTKPGFETDVELSAHPFLHWVSLTDATFELPASTADVHEEAYLEDRLCQILRDHARRLGILLE